MIAKKLMRQTQVMLVRIMVSLGNVNKHYIYDGNNDVDLEHSQQLRIVEIKTVCKTVSRSITAVTDATVTVVTADAVDASRWQLVTTVTIMQLKKI